MKMKFKLGEIQRVFCFKTVNRQKTAAFDVKMTYVLHTLQNLQKNWLRKSAAWLLQSFD